MKESNFLDRVQANFLAGLVIIFPAVVSVAVLVWLFGTVSHLTDVLLVLVPKEWTHADHGKGPMFWYWSLVALVLTIGLVCLVGRCARNFFGRRIIQLVDAILLRVPLLNKIYSTIKQVNEAFSSNKSSFKQVVLVKFPHGDCYSMGFVTGEQKFLPEKAGEKVFSVFIPTTPNPTSGFLIFVPANEITKLNLSVPEGIKLIISAGSITPDQGVPESMSPSTDLSSKT